MKKSYFWGLLIAIMALIPGQNVFAQVAADQLPTGYCSVTKRMNESCTGSDLDNVHSHSIQGLTATYEGSEVLSLSATSTTFNDLTSSKQFTVGQGGTIEITFTNGAWSKNVWFGFDWDRDGDFEDVVAAYGEEGRVGGTSDQGSVTIYVPDDAQAGKSVMRIISDGVDCATSWSEETPMCGTHGTGYIGYAGSLHDVTIIVEEVELEGEIFTISVSSNDDTMGAATAESTSVRDGRPATLTATANEGYKFVNWTVEGTEVSTENPYKPIITAATNFVANFEALPTYAVSVAANNDAFGSVEASAESVFEGSTVTLTATAKEGYRFENWTVAGSVVSTENPYTATITAETAFVANFKEVITIATGKEYRIKDISANQYLTALNYDAHTSGAYGGVGTSAYAEDNEDQIFIFEESGENYKLKTKSGYYIYAQAWNVDALSSQSSEFKFPENGTSGYYMQVYNTNNGNAWYYVKNEYVAAASGYYLFGDAAIGAAATWVLEPVAPAVVTFTVTAVPSDGAMGAVSPETSTVEEGQTVTLTATANEGYEFVNWTSGTNTLSEENPFTITPASDTTIVANFQLIPTTVTYPITVSSSDETMGTVEASATEIVEGETVVLTATPVAGYVFKNWTVGTEEVSTENPYTTTITAETAFVANFEKAPADDATLALIEEAKALIVKDGVGYPSAEAKATFKEALDVAENNPYAGAATALQTAMDAYIDTDDIVLPTADKAYAFISRGKTANFYMYNNAGTLALASYTEGMELPATAIFVCQYDEEASKYVFKTSDGSYYLAYPSPGKAWLNDKSETGLETELRRVSQFSIETLTIDGTNVVATPEDLFGYVHLWGYRGNETKNGVTSDFNGPMIVTSAGAFDGAAGDFYNSSTSSAFSVIEVELPTPTFAVSAVSADATMGSATVSAAEVEEGAEATFTATANAGYKFTCWTVGTDTISTENPYTATISAATELTANFEALVPSIVLTATPDVERQFLFTVENETKLYIDWGNGELKETEDIYEAWKEGGVVDPSWVSDGATTIIGTPVGEGIVKIYGDGITYFDCGYSYSSSYASKVTALDVTKATSLIEINISSNEIAALDLTNNTALYKITADNNATLAILELPESEMNVISAVNCALTSIDVSKLTTLTSLKLNNNNIGNIDLSANTALVTLELNNTGITSIDLSNNTALTSLYINFNNIPTLDVTALTSLKYFHCEGSQISDLKCTAVKSRARIVNNNLTLATMPAITTSTFVYAPQNAMAIATEINEGEELDLSAQNNIVGLADEAQATDYTWYLADGTEFTNYTEADGKFVFDVTADTELYCTMTTAAFPSFSGANAFKTTNIVVKNVAVPVTISVATSNEYYGTVAIDGVTGTSTEVMAGEDVTVVATPAEAFADYIVYEFEAWTAGTDTISTENPYTFTAAEALSLTANFGCYMMVNVTASEGGSAYINDAVAEATVKLPYQSKATLHAVANEGYAFSHWTYTTATGTETVWNESTADQQFTVGQYTAFTAYFVPVATERKVQIQSNDITMGCVTIISPSLGGTGTGTGTGTGSATSGGGQKPWIITSEDVTAQAFTNGSTYEFVNWTINGEEVGTETTYTYTGSEEAVIQANFRVKVVTYNVNIATATGQETFGTVEIVGYEGTSANIEAGTEITIVATPAEGYQFMSWSDALGSDVSTEASYTFTVNSSVYLEAWFESAPVATTYKLMIGVAPTAECGTVEIVGYEGTSADIEENASVTITATANEGYELIGWSSDLGATFVSTESSYTFTMTSATILQAFFEEAEVVVPTTYAVSVQAAPTSDYGTVAIEGAEGTTAQIEENASVTVVATPAEGYALEGWYDITGATLLSTDLSYTFTVTAETTVVAWFMEATPEAPEYCIDFGTSTRSGGRYMESLTFSDGAHETTVNVNQQNGYGAPIYFDKTDVNVSLEASKTITSNVNWHGEWMHSYLFVDWNNDGEFTRNLGTNLVPEEDSELIAFSFWSGVDGNSQENEGYNSAGQYITGDNRSVWALPEFTIPASIAEGTYRARLKIDWNTADPCSVMSAGDAPCVVDFMITVTYPDGIADADADAVQVYATNGVIYINGYEGNVKVVNAAGQVVKDVMVNGAEQLNVNAGLYMVVTGNQVTKVVVK